MAEETRIPEKKYYLDVNLEEAETNIHACLRDAARSVIAVGHYLKVIPGIKNCIAKPDMRMCGIMQRIGSVLANRRPADT